MVPPSRVAFQRHRPHGQRLGRDRQGTLMDRSSGCLCCFSMESSLSPDSGVACIHQGCKYLSWVVSQPEGNRRSSSCPLLLHAASQLDQRQILMVNKTRDEIFPIAGVHELFDALPVPQAAHVLEGKQTIGRRKPSAARSTSSTPRWEAGTVGWCGLISSQPASLNDHVADATRLHSQETPTLNVQSCGWAGFSSVVPGFQRHHGGAMPALWSAMFATASSGVPVGTFGGRRRLGAGR